MLGHAPILWPVPSPVLLLNFLGSFSKPVIKAQNSLLVFSKPVIKAQNSLLVFSRTIYLKTILTSPRVSGPVHRENQLVNVNKDLQHKSLGQYTGPGSFIIFETWLVSTD